MNREVNRRQFFRRAAIVAAGAAVAACAPPAPATPAPAATPVPVKATPLPSPVAPAELESPMLAELVKAGKLPPLKDRLPTQPFVVGPGVLIAAKDLPDWQPGKHGGTLRVGHSVANWNPDVFVMMNEPLLIAPGIGVENIRGNIVETFQVANDNRDFTFTLRKGLRWSDGTPVTTEDVRFTYEDIRLNERLTPVFPARFRTGGRADGKPMTLSIVDDHTFRISFPDPYGGFLRQLNIEGWVGYTELINPAHHLKKWHIKYTPLEQMKDELAKLNLTDQWWELWGQQKYCANWHMTHPRCVGHPSLNPWISVPSGDPALMAFERNPYYHKVDTQGRQLPYVDKILSRQVENVEMLNMQLLVGEIDFMRESTALVRVPLYKEAEEKAGFRVVLLDMHVDSSSIRMNQTFDDPDWRPVVRDLRFRQAVSLAINRKELIETVYFGHASLPLVTVGEEFSKFDVARANKLLDEMGLKRGADGTRLYPGGKPVNILLEHALHAPDLGPVAELTATALNAVGIKVTVKQIDTALFATRWAANQIQMSVHWSNDRGWSGDLVVGNITRAGNLWHDWRVTLGKSGEEPPAWIKEAITIDANRWAAVPGTPEFERWVKAGEKWCRDNLPYINLVEQVKYPMAVSRRIGNVPQSGFAIAANFSGEQLFFKS